MLSDAVRPAAAPDTALRRPQLIASLLLFSLLGLVTAALGAALPTLRYSYELDNGNGAGAVSAYNLGALAGILACGFVRGRFAQKTALRALLAMFALGAATMGITTSWPVFCAAAFAAGSGYGGLVLYLNSIFARCSSAQSFTMLSSLNATFGIGAILGPIAVSSAGNTVGIVFLAAGLLSTTGAGVCGLPAATHAKPTMSGARRPIGLHAKVAFAFLTLGFLYAGLEVGTSAWLATHLDWSGLTASESALTTSLFWMGLAAGRLTVPPLVKGRAPRDVIGAALLAAAAAYLTAAQPQLAAYAYTACGLFLAPILPALLQWIAHNVDDNQPANAMLFSASMAGGIALPALIGTLARPDNPATIPLTIAGLALLAAATTRLLARFAKSQPPPGAG